MAGITSLQPGIESFSDHILGLMDKGATAFQQITFIKRAHQVGVQSAYNILLRNPGETAEDYREMTELVPFISHLQPPNGVANVELERFSPYFLRPSEFGIRNVRPKPHYRVMFSDPGVDLDGLVYQFDFDHDALDAPELLAARREFLDALARWQAGYAPHQLVYFVIDGAVRIVDQRRQPARALRLAGLDASLLLMLDAGRAFPAIRERCPGVADEELRARLEHLVQQRLVYHAHRGGKDAYLAVPVRVYRSLDEFHAQYREELALAEVRRLAAPHAPSPARPLTLRIDSGDRGGPPHRVP